MGEALKILVGPEAEGLSATRSQVVAICIQRVKKIGDAGTTQSWREVLGIRLACHAISPVYTLISIPSLYGCRPGLNISRMDN